MADRLVVQRLAEQRSGHYGDVEVFVGDLVQRHGGGIEGAISRLHLGDPAMRDAAVDQLHQLPGFPELVAAVNAELATGAVTAEERESILQRSQPCSPARAAIPAPPEYPPIPPDHPESWEEKHRRDPPCEAVEPDPEQQTEFAELDRRYEAGEIDRQANRTAMSEIIEGRRRFGQ